MGSPVIEWTMYQQEPGRNAIIGKATMRAEDLPQDWPAGGNLKLKTRDHSKGKITPRIHLLTSFSSVTNMIDFHFADPSSVNVQELWNCLSSDPPKAGEILSNQDCGIYFTTILEKRNMFRIYYRPGAIPISDNFQRKSQSIENVTIPKPPLPSTVKKEVDIGFVSLEGKLKIESEFLKREAFHRHEWVFGAFAELIHNANDAGATEVCIRDIKHKKKTLIEINDDGDGMGKQEIDLMMQLGRKQELSNAYRSGRFGYGFKTGSMRIAKHALVFSRAKASKNVCLGILSREKPSGEPNILCETLELHLHEDGFVTTGNLYNYKHILNEIENRTRIINQLFIGSWVNKQKRHGTSILLCDLHETSNAHGENELELDLQSNPHDIRIWQESLEGERVPFQRKHKDGVLAIDIKMDYSLREYMSIMFRTLRTQNPTTTHPNGLSLAMMLRGKPIDRKDICSQLDKIQDLSLTVNDFISQYNKNDSTAASISSCSDKIEIHIGFSQEYKSKYLGGIMLYSANCLINSFLREAAGLTSPQDGLGTVAIVELPKTVFEPQDNKQGFNNSKLYKRLLLHMKKVFTWYVEKLEMSNMKCIQSSKVDKSLVDDWVRCDACNKWRKLPVSYVETVKNQQWMCFSPGSPLLEVSQRPCKLPEEKENDYDQIVVQSPTNDCQHYDSYSAKRAKIKENCSDNGHISIDLSSTHHSSENAMPYTIVDGEDREVSYKIMNKFPSVFGKLFFIEMKQNSDPSGKWKKGAIKILKKNCVEHRKLEAIKADIIKLAQSESTVNVIPILFFNQEMLHLGLDVEVQYYVDYRRVYHKPSCKVSTLYNILMDAVVALEWCLKKEIKLLPLKTDHIYVDKNNRGIYSGLWSFHDFFLNDAQHTTGGRSFKDQSRLPVESTMTLENSNQVSLIKSLVLDLLVRGKRTSTSRNTPNLSSNFGEIPNKFKAFSAVLNREDSERDSVMSVSGLISKLQKLKNQIGLIELCSGDMFHVCLNTTKFKTKGKKNLEQRFCVPERDKKIGSYPENNPPDDAIPFIASFEKALYTLLCFYPSSDVIVACPAAKTMEGSIKRQITLLPIDGDKGSRHLMHELQNMFPIFIKANSMPITQAFSIRRNLSKPLVRRLLMSTPIDCRQMPFLKWKSDFFYLKFSPGDRSKLREELAIDVKEAMHCHQRI